MSRCEDCGFLERMDVGWKFSYCIWHRKIISEEDIIIERKCSDFEQKIPGLSPKDQLATKQVRDAIKLAKKSKNQANLANIISVLALFISVISLLKILGYLN